MSVKVERKFFSKASEAVSIGHPDKVADQISDTVFDLIRSKKRDGKSAVETACGATKLLVFGEIDGSISLGDDEVRAAVRSRLNEIGYDESFYDPEIVVDLVKQSSEINQAVVEAGADHTQTGAGDQGFVTGFATKETPEGHGLHFVLAHLIQTELEAARLGRPSLTGLGLPDLSELYPDAKSQVTVKYEYQENAIDIPIKIENILLSTAHRSDVDFDALVVKLREFVLSVVRNYLTSNGFDAPLASLDEVEVLINPAGPWSHCGPAADSGLTGRKLVVDNYGSAAGLGGGATSGKDLTKVDRSGAYFARHIAKSIVASGLADKALVELGFAIGVPQPTMISVDVFGTQKPGVDLDLIEREVLHEYFDFSVDNIVAFSSSVPSFVATSQHGNYLNSDFPWETPVIMAHP